MNPTPSSARARARSIFTWIKLAAAVLLAAFLAVLMLGSSDPNSIPVAPVVTATPADNATPFVPLPAPTEDHRTPTAVVPADTYVPGHIFYVKNQIIYSVHHSEAPQEITTGSEPALAPDGTQLAFIVFSKNYQDLYLLNMKTRGLRELVNDYYSDPQDARTGLTAAVPAWTDDSRHVLFSWSFPGAPLQNGNFDRLGLSITECPAEGPCTTASNLKLTTPALLSGGDYDAAARPGDPNTIVYSKYQYETARDGTQRSLASLVALNITTGGSIGLTPILDNDSQAAWSPDGNYLIYMKTSDDMKTTSLWAMAFHAPGDPNDEAKGHEILTGNTFVSNPVFSPDGKDLAYLSTGDDGHLHLFTAQIHLGANPTIDHVQEVQRAGIVDGDRLVWGH